MHNIGVVGEQDAVLAFRAIGLDVAAVDTPQEAANAVRRMAQAGYAVIFVTETTAEGIMDTLERYRVEAQPAVIPIPGSQGSTGFAMSALRRNVERAIGADILFGGEN